MKLKKLIERYLACKTRLVIKVIEPSPDGTDLKRVVTTPVYAVSEEYPELMSCKVLQIDLDKGELAIIITESKNEVH